MSKSLTPINTNDAGWVLAMTEEMAEAAGVAAGSQVIFYFKDGAVSAEILPPLSEELRSEVQAVASEFAEAFAGMKRRGD